MGWGIARQRAYNLLLRLTRQTLEREDSRDGKPVSEVFGLEAATDLTITLASARAYHSMDSRDDQSPRRRCSSQDYAWSSVCECISGSHGITDFHEPSLKTDTPT